MKELQARVGGSGLTLSQRAPLNQALQTCWTTAPILLLQHMSCTGPEGRMRCSGLTLVLQARRRKFLPQGSPGLCWGGGEAASKEPLSISRLPRRRLSPCLQKQVAVGWSDITSVTTVGGRSLSEDYLYAFVYASMHILRGRGILWTSVKAPSYQMQL